MELHTKPVENIVECTELIGSVIARINQKITIFEELFDNWAGKETLEFDAHISLFDGLKSICTEMRESIYDAEDKIQEINEDILSCNFDPEKRKEREKYYRSIGIEVNNS